MTAIQKNYIPSSVIRPIPPPTQYQYTERNGSTSWSMPEIPLSTFKRSLTPYSFEWLQTHKSPTTFSERFTRLQKAVAISNATKTPDAPGAVYLISPEEDRFAGAQALDFLTTVGKTHYIALNRFDSSHSIRQAKQELNAHPFNTLIIAAHGNEDGIALSQRELYKAFEPADFEDFDPNGSVCLLSCSSESIGEKLKDLLVSRDQKFQGTLYAASENHSCLNTALINEENKFHVFHSENKFNNLIDDTQTIQKKDQDLHLNNRMKFLKKTAITQKDSKLLIALSAIHYQGFGVPQSYEEALKFLEKAAGLKNADAAHRAGLMHHAGKGCKTSYPQALYFFELAASLGNTNAAYEAAIMYLSGKGCITSHSTALQFLTQAAPDNGDAAYEAGSMYYDGKGCKRSVSKALYFFELAASLGNTDAAYDAAIMYSSGMGCQRSESKAFRFFRQAASEDRDTAYEIGSMYYDGKDCERSLSKAFYFFKQAEALGNTKSFLTLATMYRNGEGCNQSVCNMLDYLEKGAENNDPEALFQLGQHYSQQDPFQPSKTFTIIDYYQRAAALNHPEATFQLGLYYLDARDTVKPLTKAHEYLEKAQALGHPKAGRFLEEFLSKSPTVSGRKIVSI